MDQLGTEEICGECGGTITPRSHAGRTKRYRGVWVVYPSVPTPTCEGCGATWMDGALVDQVYGAFDQQVDAGVRPSAVPR
jgi:hypothetical protein